MLGQVSEPMGDKYPRLAIDGGTKALKDLCNNNRVSYHSIHSSGNDANGLT